MDFFGQILRRGPAASGPVTGIEERDHATSSHAPADKDTGGKEPAVKKPRGRPVRYTNKSKVCRIPVELEEEARVMLQIVCPKNGISEKALVRFKTALRELCENGNYAKISREFCENSMTSN